MLSANDFLIGLDEAGGHHYIVRCGMKRRFDGSAVRLLGVSSLNSGRANARPFFFVRRHRAVSNIVGRVSPRLDIGKNGDLLIDRRKITARLVEQLVEVVANE